MYIGQPSCNMASKVCLLLVYYTTTVVIIIIRSIIINVCIRFVTMINVLLVCIRYVLTVLCL